MQLNWVYIYVVECQMTPLKVLLHTAHRLQRWIITPLHAPVTALMFGCSGTQIYNPEVRDEGSGQFWDNDRASWSSVDLV